MNNYNETEVADNSIGLCFTQMHASKGIKLLGQKALDAMETEYKQLDDLKVFKPRYVSDISKEDKKKSLRAIDLIKIKRSGKVKGRTLADGSKQRGYISKDNTTSPAAHLDSLIATLVIDAMERREVATADIAGAYLKAHMPDFVLLRVTGPAVDALVKTNREKYADYVTYEGDKKVFYLELVKAMYGTLKAAILWYILFAGTLKEQGFQINPYEPCVANKMVNGKQLTILWYVDDIKISHEDSRVVQKTLDYLEKEFGKMSIKKGKKHVYLGMKIEFIEDKVKILMDDYIQECIDDFGEKIHCSAKTPATRDLMEVVSEEEEVNEKYLDQDKVAKFHSIVAKLLYISKRARLDIQVATAFLSTRVQKPTENDWQKLRRLIQYLHGTIHMARYVSLKNILEMDIFIDASHAVHPDMKGHTGGCTSTGVGVIHSRSSKQRLNTKSSTESELVRASEYIPFAIWMLYFFK